MFTITEEDFYTDGAGICLNCGEIRWSGVEPDATGYPCDECDIDQVVGMQEAILMGEVEVEFEDHGDTRRS